MKDCCTGTIERELSWKLPELCYLLCKVYLLHVSAWTCTNLQNRFLSSVGRLLQQRQNQALKYVFWLEEKFLQLHFGFGTPPA